MGAEGKRLPKTVLMTADTVGGVWTYAVELAGALDAQGIEVVLATMGGLPSADQTAEVKSLRRVRLCPSAFRLEWMPRPWDDIERAGEWLLGLERQYQPELIHLNSYVHGSLPWRAPVLMVGHSDVLSWWEAVHGRPAPEEEWGTYARRVRSGLRAAATVVAPSRAMLAALERHYGPLGPAEVIPNARSAERYWAVTKEPLILSAGRIWDRAKNISALATLAPALPWPVYIAGETGNPDGGETASVAGLHTLGRLSAPELAGWYARASIYVMPALYEPFGLSILEAALSGCALVLGDIPSLRENWQDAAVFVDGRDPLALEGALQGLIADRPFLERLARSAYERASKFTPERMLAQYLDRYATLVEAREAAA